MTDLRDRIFQMLENDLKNGCDLTNEPIGVLVDNLLGYIDYDFGEELNYDYDYVNEQFAKYALEWQTGRKEKVNE